MSERCRSVDTNADITHSHVLSTAALTELIYVGALPILFSGVNNPVVIRRKTPA